MGKIKYTKEVIEPIIKASTSWKDLAKRLGVVKANGLYRGIKRAAERYNLNLEHLNNSDFLWKKRSDEEVFCENSEVDRLTVKDRIFKNNLIPYECWKCGNKGEWQGEKMSLILDHINGINNYNKLENLRFVCPNCDAISPTFKNKKRK